MSCVIKTHFIHVVLYRSQKDVNVNTSTSQNQLKTLYGIFFIVTIIYYMGGNISRARATQLHFMRTKAVATAARAMLVVGKPNEWCLRVRVFYHLDFFFLNVPHSCTRAETGSCLVVASGTVFFFKRQ